MRVYCIEKIVFFGNTDQLSEFHYIMFHGEARRPVPEADERTDREWGFAGCGVNVPLSIMRPGNEIPPVSQPDRNLVVDETMAVANLNRKMGLWFARRKLRGGFGSPDRRGDDGLVDSLLV